MLHDTGVSAALLKFEVTEAALISNVGAAREALERLHQLGVQVMLDDFGTGFSSLNYLQMFPLDYVKIDRPFVTRTFSDRANSGMMSAMLQMASSSGPDRDCGEHRNRSGRRCAAREIGCAFGQGYFFSEPVQADVALLHLRGEPFVGRQQMAASDAAATTMAAPPLESPEDDSPTLMIPVESAAQDELDEVLIGVSARADLRRHRARYWHARA